MHDDDNEDISCNLLSIQLSPYIYMHEYRRTALRTDHVCRHTHVPLSLTLAFNKQTMLHL